MAAKVEEDTPCYLVKEQSRIDRDFIDLIFKRSLTAILKKPYLLQQVSKEKKQTFSARLGSYIQDMMYGDRMVQYYMTVHTNRSFTYLAAKYFTLGLLQVEDKAMHLIQNEAKSGPIYLYVCSPSKNERYVRYANSHKAFVKKSSIIADFDPVTIEPGKYRSVASRSIYFFYTVTHCMFRCTSIGQDETCTRTKNTQSVPTTQTLSPFGIHARASTCEQNSEMTAHLKNIKVEVNSD